MARLLLPAVLVVQPVKLGLAQELPLVPLGRPQPLGQLAPLIRAAGMVLGTRQKQGPRGQLCPGLRCRGRS